MGVGGSGYVFSGLFGGILDNRVNKTHTLTYPSISTTAADSKKPVVRFGNTIIGCTFYHTN